MVRTRRLTAIVAALARGETPKVEPYVAPVKPHRLFPALLAPHGRPTLHRQNGLHPQRFGRLVREHDRLCKLLEALPTRRTWPRMRARLETQFRNRLTRIRRQLGLPTLEPPRRAWHRIASAAALLGVCTKTVLRWEKAGLIESWRADSWGAHRYFRDADLRQLRARLKD